MCLQPMRALYLRMPAVATLVLVIGAGYIIGGIRSALVVGGLTLFIALSPWWDRALVTTVHGNFWSFYIQYNWIYSWNFMISK